MSTGFSFGTSTLGSTTVAASGTGAGGGFSFGTGASSNPSVGLNFGTLGSTATPATTSASSGGFGTGLFGSKPAIGFTLGGTSTGKENGHIFREYIWDFIFFKSAHAPIGH
uniref:Nucleoporin 58 n=1 Tax=Molossus molossus TaxID=27622 RepID=A0A7J8G0E9_MOLMO|nr:nucleoporin 58 [Molossus molossus]